MKVFSVPVDLSQEHTSHLIYLSLNTFWHASSFSAPLFFPAKPPTLVVPVFIPLCSLYSCSAPLPINLPLFLKFCIYILLRCGSPSQSCSCAATLRRRLLSSCSFALNIHLQCCRSWPDLHTHAVCLSLPSLLRGQGGREAEYQ